MIETYEDALTFIHGRPRFKKKPTLERMKLFLHLLGDPQKQSKYVHITGTNGKGSTVAMMRDMLIQTGLNVGTFTSPFITRFNERIAINGEAISDGDLVSLTKKVAPIVEQLDKELTEGGPTEFEIDTAIMFCYFAKTRPDIVLLEVGIGGLYDSTNVIVPEVSVITTVGWDHMKYLGNTLGEIASQKAGIIKKHLPVVIGNLPLSARLVVEEVAKKENAPLYELGKDFSVSKLNLHALTAKISYHGLSLRKFEVTIGLAGDYQVDNAAVALTATQLLFERLGIKVVASDFKAGLAGVKWPGRMEKVMDEPLVFLDGAHNLPGMQSLVNTLKDDFSGNEIYVLVAILADKQYELMLGELASLPNVHLMVTNFSIPGMKSRPSADLLAENEDFKTRYPIRKAPNWQTGFVELTQNMSTNDVLVITGSLYFISEIRKILK